MSAPETEFIRACAKRTNDLHRKASAEYIRLLVSFLTLGAILIMLTFALIALKWAP